MTRQPRSGSGPAVFGFFPDLPEAEDAARGCTQQNLLQSGGDAPYKRRRKGRLSQLLPEKSLSKAPVVTLRKEIESRPHERAAEMKDVMGRDLGAILKFALQTERKCASEGLAVVAAPA